MAAAFATDPMVAPEQLIRLFDDEDPTVRKAAASAARMLNDADADAATAEVLVASFTASAAYEAHFDELFFVLSDSTRLLPEASITACERAVEIAGHELGDIRTHHAATSVDRSVLFYAARRATSSISVARRRASMRAVTTRTLP
ncbi:MAG: hypothetical protein ACRDTD_26960, partial [Pseudonocardiaceae bacterium]